MELALVVFLAGVALLVLALAVYLIVVAVKLRSVIATLGRVAEGIDRMAHQTEPVDELVGGLADAVGSFNSVSRNGRL